MRFHDLRDSCASILYSQGVSPPVDFESRKGDGLPSPCVPRWALKFLANIDVFRKVIVAVVSVKKQFQMQNDGKMMEFHREGREEVNR